MKAKQKPKSFLTRRHFLSAVSLGFAALATPRHLSANQTNPDDKFILNELTLDQLQECLKSGRFTSRSLVEMYLARIEQIDRQGPALRSVLEINPDALALAVAADRARKANQPLGLLHGIPILIKDNIDTADKMQTTAGSLALVGSKPPKDAFVVTRLRQAGAILLGKTNLSEWANIRCSYSTSGWSGRGGQTRNPYALDRNPCGSSSGSAVAVSANLCAVAVGTETDGSIVSPSSANGIVGLKPTVGLVSRTGIIPISHSQDTAGPMTRTVRDAAILLSAMTGIDHDDPATSDAGEHRLSDYTKNLDPNALKGARLGVVRSLFGFHDQVDLVMNEVLQLMKDRGAILIDPVEIAGLDKLGDAEQTVLNYELKADMNAYLTRLGKSAPVHTLKEIIDFNIRHKDKEMIYFGQDTLEKAESKGPLSSYEYQEALARCRRITRTEGIDAVMEKNNLDALIAPTLGPASVIDWINGDRWLGGSSTPSAVAGYPSLSVPAGEVYGLPIGLLFFGKAWSEATLLRLGYAFEQATKRRKPPHFLAKAVTP